ncbi:MAG: GNAT family N-acetyltransferase [Lutisporaceae bacterium]
MALIIRRMSNDEAKQVSKWIYEPPYSIYSMDESDDSINELLNGYYFSVLDEANNLVGYYCFGESAQVPAGNQFGVYNSAEMTDIGLGIKPDLCGQGLGLRFLSSGLDFARDTLSAKGFRLTVATFNKRAIKTYERVGFKKVNSFKRASVNGNLEFWVMVLC